MATLLHFSRVFRALRSLRKERYHSGAWWEGRMDASRVLGTLRAHCDRLELELRELDADVEEAKAMVRVTTCRPPGGLRGKRIGKH